jgi:pantothenate synthetase
MSPPTLRFYSSHNAYMSEKQAKQASKKIFKGLEQAKAHVGDQQTRREAMDYGHEKASEKLEDLADRAKAADTPDDLNPVDQMFLKNIQTKK